MRPVRDVIIASAASASASASAAATSTRTDAMTDERARQTESDRETDWTPLFAIQGARFLHGDRVTFKGREMIVSSGFPGGTGVARGNLVRMIPVQPISVVELDADPFIRTARKLCAPHPNTCAHTPPGSCVYGA